MKYFFINNNLSYYDADVLKALNYAAKDRVAKVQQAAQEARREWEQLRAAASGKEEKKTRSPDQEITGKQGLSSEPAMEGEKRSRKKFSVFKHIMGFQKALRNPRPASRDQASLSSIAANWAATSRAVKFLKRGMGIGGGYVPLPDIRETGKNSEAKRTRPSIKELILQYAVAKNMTAENKNKFLPEIRNISKEDKFSSKLIASQTIEASNPESKMDIIENNPTIVHKDDKLQDSINKIEEISKDSLIPPRDSEIVIEENAAKTPTLNPNKSEVPLKDSLIDSQTKKILPNNSLMISPTTEALQKDSLINPEDSEITEKESKIISRDTEISPKDKLDFPHDSQIVQRDSLAIPQDLEIVQEDNVVHSNDPTQNAVIIPKECEIENTKMLSGDSQVIPEISQKENAIIKKESLVSPENEEIEASDQKNNFPIDTTKQMSEIIPNSEPQSITEKQEIVPESDSLLNLKQEEDNRESIFEITLYNKKSLQSDSKSNSPETVHKETEPTVLHNPISQINPIDSLVQNPYQTSEVNFELEEESQALRSRINPLPSVKTKTNDSKLLGDKDINLHNEDKNGSETKLEPIEEVYIADFPKDSDQIEQSADSNLPKQINDQTQLMAEEKPLEKDNTYLLHTSPRGGDISEENFLQSKKQQIEPLPVNLEERDIINNHPDMKDSDKKDSIPKDSDKKYCIPQDSDTTNNIPQDSLYSKDTPKESFSGKFKRGQSKGPSHIEQKQNNNTEVAVNTFIYDSEAASNRTQPKMSPAQNFSKIQPLDSLYSDNKSITPSMDYISPPIKEEKKVSSADTKLKKNPELLNKKETVLDSNEQKTGIKKNKMKIGENSEDSALECKYSSYKKDTPEEAINYLKGDIPQIPEEESILESGNFKFIPPIKQEIIPPQKMKVNPVVTFPNKSEKSPTTILPSSNQTEIKFFKNEKFPPETDPIKQLQPTSVPKIQSQTTTIMPSVISRNLGFSSQHIDLLPSNDLEKTLPSNEMLEDTQQFEGSDTVRWSSQIETLPSQEYETTFNTVLHNEDDIHLLRLLLQIPSPATAPLSPGTSESILSRLNLIVRQETLNEMLLSWIEDSANSGQFYSFSKDVQNELLDTLYQIGNSNSILATRSLYIYNSLRT